MESRTPRATSLAAALLAGSTAAACAAPLPATLPLSYVACPPAAGDPSHISIANSPKGPVVTFQRADLGAPTTRDVNIAYVSRRLFFTLRIPSELIEFQGRARDDALEGVLSDHAGARHIVMPADPAGRGCEARR